MNTIVPGERNPGWRSVSLFGQESVGVNVALGEVVLVSVAVGVEVNIGVSVSNVMTVGELGVLAGVPVLIIPGWVKMGVSVSGCGIHPANIPKTTQVNITPRIPGRRDILFISIILKTGRTGIEILG